MNHTPRQLNPDILRERLPDNYLTVLSQAETNIQNAVGVLIDDYKKRLQSQIDQLQNGTFPQDFQTSISDLEDTLKTGLNQARRSVRDVKDKADELKEKVKDSTAVNNIANELLTESTKLQQMLDETLAKVKDLGKLSGKVLAAALSTLL